MKTTTHGVMELNKSLVFINNDSSTVTIVSSFASEDGLHMAAHVRMTVKEARTYAHLLIAAAERLEPECV